MASRQQQNELWDAIEIIHRYYEELFRPVANAFSITTGQLKLLHTLHRYGALSIGELAGLLGMARTNASSLCKKLCKQGFLLRHRGGGGDDRQVLLELTPEGESAARQAEGQLDTAAPVLRESDLGALVEALEELSAELSPAPLTSRPRKAPRPVAAAARMLECAKVAILEKTSKKELQHGKD